MRDHTFTQTHSFVKALMLCCSVVALMLACGMAVQAQEDQNQIMPARGFHPSHSYSMGDIETINTLSGNLMLDIPLASLPAGRGGHPGFQLSLRYNSKIYDGESDTAENPNRPNELVDVVWLKKSQEGGWRYNIPKGYHWFLDNRNNHGVVYPPSDPRHTHIWRMKLVAPDGSARDMRPYGFDDGANDGYFAVMPAAGMTYFSVDGSFLRLDILASGAWNLYFPDGTKVVNVSSGVQRMFDRHGSFIETTSVTNYNGTGHPADIISDQLGRSIVIEYGTNEDYIRATGVNGAAVVTTVKWGSTHVSKVYRAGNHFQFDVTLNIGFKVVTEISLPTQIGPGMKYLFGYNGNPAVNMGTSIGWGELSSLTLPSNAVATYQYDMDNKSGSGFQANWVLENSPVRKDLNYALEYDGVVTAGPTLSWSYSLGASGGGVLGPDGGVTQEWASEGLSMGRVYKTRNPNGTIIERLWKQNRPFSPPGVTFAANAAVNPFVEAEFYSVPDASGALILTSMRHYTYDKNGNLTQLKEYDWVPYNTIPRDSFGLPTGIPAGAAIKRMTTTAYHCETPGALVTNISDTDSYDRAGSPSFKKAAKSTVIGTASQTMARSEFTYDDPLTTANLTEQRQWDSTKGPINASAPFLDANNSIATSTQYNQFGNPTLTTDARQVQTQLIYGQVGSFIDLYPTEIRTALGTPVQRIEKRDYDFNTGLVTRLTDFDNNVATSTQYDALGRPILVRMAEGKPEEMQTSTQYFGPERRIVTRSDLDATGDGKITRVVHYDQLGRVRLTRTLEEYSVAAIANETIGIKTQTRYLTFNPCLPFNNGQCLDANKAVLANYVLTSNAYRAATPGAATGESTMGWMRVRTDNSGRTVEIRTFAGVNLPGPWDTNTVTTGGVTTEYDGVYTKVIDQAGKVRRSRVDGVGQLIRVDEPSDALNNLGSQSLPNQATTYDYNVFGSLISVVQGGQTRSYVYSSLNRLTQATNPESGTVNYEYDASGNVTKKIDPRMVPNTSTRQATTYTYDALGRLTARTYNNGSPNVTLTYDAPAVAFGRGRLAQVSSSVSSYTYVNYDAIGRALATKQTTDGQEYSMQYAYNIAGGVVSQTYPSGKVVKTNYDAAGRVAGIKNDATGNYYVGAASTDAINRVQYAPSGAIEAVKLGNNLWEHTVLNSRLQPTQIGLGTSASDSSKLRLDYTYGVVVNGTLDTAQNNGNLQSQTITVPGAVLTATYTYDELNRLKSAEENNGATPVWKQVYDYDRFGNRRFNSATTVPNVSQNPAVVNPDISGTNNRISTAGYRYDAAGNLECEPTHPCGSVSPFVPYYEYDTENRVKTAFGGPANGGSTYLYDGEGRRVKKIVGGVNASTTVFVYNVVGQLVAEFSDAPQAPSTPVTYVTADHLGSPRAITDANGAVVSRHDYQPFGEEVTRSGIAGYGQPDNLNHQFAGQERDDETGLDYFGARYYTRFHGRFTSADYFVNDTSPIDPSTWNLYAYARNNPLRYIDPNGERIYVGGITNADDREELLRRVNRTYGCEDCVGVDADGFLTVDTSNLSEEVVAATQFLTDAINTNDPTQLYNVEITNNNDQVAFGDSGTRRGVNVRNASGGTTFTSAINIRLDFGDDQHVQGNAAARASFLDMVFAHEVSHFAPSYKTDPTTPGERGPVDNPINVIRLALGLPLRASYQANSIGPIAILKFGSAIQLPQEGCLPDQKPEYAAGRDGLEVSSESQKIVTWYIPRVKRN